jgi:hypothetical protein
MQFPALITTDLHLVEDPDAEYRWGLFDWLNEQSEAHRVKSIRVLGDITDAKDNHSASLTNRVVQSFRGLRCKDKLIMSGNHDWLVRGQEFFRFLNDEPGMQFITKPTEDQDVHGPTTLYLPHTKNPRADWSRFSFDAYDFVFMHQTITGAVASNGQRMEGEPLPDYRAAGRVYSGDIHVPQKLNGLTYIGAPYHVHFGDNYKPRVLLLDKNGREVWLHYPAPKRMMLVADDLQDLKSAELSPGDQVKVTLNVSPAEKHEWASLRREATRILEDRGALVKGLRMQVQGSARTGTERAKLKTEGVTPADALARFVAHEELGGLALDVALRLIK